VAARDSKHSPAAANRLAAGIDLFTTVDSRAAIDANGDRWTPLFMNMKR
jgi:hypothetical protein